MGVKQRGVLQRDGAGADLLQLARHGQRATACKHTIDQRIAAADGTHAPVVASADPCVDARCNPQGAARLRKTGGDDGVVAQRQRAAVQPELARTVDAAVCRERRGAAIDLQRGTFRHLLRTSQHDRIVECGRAFAHCEVAELIEAHVAEAAEVHIAGSALGQRAGIFEAAGGTGVVVDVEVSGRRCGNQAERAGVPEQSAVFDVETAARCVGDAAFTTGVVMLQRRGVQADRHVPALVEHAAHVEHATACDRAAVPVEAAIDIRRAAGGDVQRAAAAQRVDRRNACAVAQRQYAGAVGQGAGAVDRAAGRQRGRTAEYLQ